jgi:hypothetical protein
MSTQDTPLYLNQIKISRNNYYYECKGPFLIICMLKQGFALFREGTIQVGNGDNPGILLQDIRPTAKGK